MKTLSPTKELRERALDKLGGIHAATVCPFTKSLAIDEQALADHVTNVARRPGMRGLLINGHAGENAQLTGAEKRRVIEIVREAVGPEVFLTSGVYSESSLEAQQHAKEAEDAGADAILVFPPNGWGIGQEATGVVSHHEIIASGTELPLVLYQAPVNSGRMAYPPTTLSRLVTLPSVAGIKEGSWEIASYEENRKTTKRLRPDIVVLQSGDEHLLAGYLIGTEGSQVSLAAIIPDSVIRLWEYSLQQDWANARAEHERIYDLASAIYRKAPGGWATARLKACLKILGQIVCDKVRPPIQQLPIEEYKRLEAALAKALA